MASKSTSSLAVFFHDLVRAETRLYNALGETLRAEHGIITSQFEFLRYFRDHPGSRVADVAAAFAAGIGAVSKGIDRLESQGWVSRFPHPTDGRSSLVSLTSEGTALVSAAEVTFLARLDELVSPTLDPAQLEAAGAALSALRSTLEQSKIGMPVG